MIFFILISLFLFRQDYLVENAGYKNQDFIIQTPVLQEDIRLTPDQQQVVYLYQTPVLQEDIRLTPDQQQVVFLYRTPVLQEDIRLTPDQQQVVYLFRTPVLQEDIRLTQTNSRFYIYTRHQSYRRISETIPTAGRIYIPDASS